MTDEPTDPDLDRLLDLLAKEDQHRPDPAEHPGEKVLYAYHANELSPEEDFQVQEHLSACGHCRNLLLEYSQFLGSPSETSPEGIADFELAAEWRKLRKRMANEAEREKPAVRPQRRFLASSRGGYSVAAALLMVTVGLGIWDAKLIRERRKPQPVRTVQTLEALGSSRGAPAGESEPVFLPAQITLSLPTETPAPLYRIDLMREGSRSSERALTIPSQRDELRILLPEQSLSPGRYILRATALHGGRPSSEVWSYILQLGSPEP